MLLDPNITVLRSRLTAYNTALGREMSNHLDGCCQGGKLPVALALIDELLTFWEAHHGSTPPTA